MQRKTRTNHASKQTVRALATLGLAGLLAAVPVVAQTGSIAGDAAGEAQADAAGEVAGDAAGGIAGDASGDIAGDASGDVAGDASGDTAGDASGDIAGDLNGEFTSAATADAAAQLEASADLESEVDAVVSTAAQIETESAFGAAAAAEAEASGLFGALEASGDARAGAFVAFDVSRDGKAIVNHESQGQATFSEVRLSGEAQSEATAGAAMHLWTTQAQLEAHDDAEATILVKARAATQATFKLASGAQATVHGDEVRVALSGQEGVLAIQGEGRLSQDAQGNIVAELDQGSSARFEAKAEASQQWYLEQKAYATGRLGAEASVAAGGGALRAEEYVVEVESKTIAEGEVRMQISSDDPRPRVIVFDLDADLFASGDVQVLYDGQAAAQASSAADVYAATDASQATYAMAEADGKLQAHVHAPSFSTHEVAFVESGGDAGGASQDAPAPAIALGVLALIGAAALRRR